MFYIFAVPKKGTVFFLYKYELLSKKGDLRRKSCFERLRVFSLTT